MGSHSHNHRNRLDSGHDATLGKEEPDSMRHFAKSDISIWLEPDITIWL